MYVFHVFPKPFTKSQHPLSAHNGVGRIESTLVIASSIASTAALVRPVCFRVCVCVC